MRVLLTGQQHEQHPPAGPYQRAHRANNACFTSVSFFLPKDKRVKDENRRWKYVLFC